LAPTFRGDGGKDLQACAISMQGNHIAVAGPTSVNIYDFYSCFKLRSFGLPLGLCIETLSYEGQYLFCCLKNKKIYLY
jgi:hypothetical protein